MRTFEQKKFMQGRKKVELLENGKVKVTQSSIKGMNEEVFSLFDLDEESDKYFHRPLILLGLSAFFLIGVVRFFIESAINLDPKSLNAGLIFLVPALICIQQYFYKITDVVVYRFRNNGNPALTLWNNKPNSKELSEFQSMLSTEIKSLKIRPELDNSKKLEIYKESLEFLLDQGVITQGEAEAIYDRNKDRLLNNEKAKLFSI